MEDLVRVQVDVGGTRVWVAALKSATIGQLMTQAADVFAKHKQQKIVIREVTLRGALLDPDELVGVWLRDQELLFSELAPSAQAENFLSPLPSSEPSPSQLGVLVAHEPPPATTETCELKNLSAQAVAIAVLGLSGAGKTTLVSTFSGTKAASGATIEKKLEVEGVVHKLVLVDADGTDAVLKGAHGFLCLFDVTNRASFNELQARLLGLIVASRGHDVTVPVTIIATKSDLSPRQVSVAESLQLARELQTLQKGSVALYEISCLLPASVGAAVHDTFGTVLHWRAADPSNQASSCALQ